VLKLSIIIPTFNSSGYIERCLQSIRIQTFRDYEIILQDGDSSDDTTRIAKGFRDANPGIDVKIFSEKDKGLYDAMNKGCSRASGEWLYFLGSDDELRDESVLSMVMGSQTLSRCDVIYGNVQAIGDSCAKDGSVYDGMFDLSKLLTKNICHQAIFYRAAFLRRIGEYNTRYVVWADWDFNLRCWANTEFRYVDMIVANFYAGGLSGRGADECFCREVVSNFLRYFGPSVHDPLLSTANLDAADPENVENMRKRFEMNELMFEQVETLLTRLGVRQEVIGAFLYPSWVLHSRQGLTIFGGSRLKTFRTEMRGLRREPREPSLVHHLFKDVIVGTATLLLPPPFFYRIGHWYAQKNPGRFRKQLARAAKAQSKA
jgi:glycosyltransferase involved in cell wall biosynthesis